MLARNRRWVWILVLLAGLCACDAEDEVFSDIGTTQVYFVDSGLQPQNLTDPDAPIQVAKWSVQQADLILDGVPRDLLVGTVCTFRNTIYSISVPSGKCATGLIIGAIPEVRQISMNLRFRMQVRRAEPLLLPPGGDFDGDGLINSDDNCELLPNPDQEDENSDGIGNICSIGLSRDGDGDGVIDSFDNCVWAYNPLQTDTTGLTAKGIPDGIGDACTDQFAEVQVGGNPDIQLQVGPISFVQPLGTPSFLTIDFDDQDSLVCDWTAETCQLDLAQARFCARYSVFDAVVGCP